MSAVQLPSGLKSVKDPGPHKAWRVLIGETETINTQVGSTVRMTSPIADRDKCHTAFSHFCVMKHHRSSTLSSEDEF